MAWIKTLPSGKYQALYRDGLGRERSAGTFTHKRKATAAGNAAESDARSMGWKDPEAARHTWGEWFPSWWKARAVDATTVTNELSLIEKHIRPKWENTPLTSITRQDAREWIADLVKTERRLSVADTKRRAKALEEDPDAHLERRYLSAASVHRIVQLWSSSLTAAVDAEILPANPAYRLKLPRRPQAGERYLTGQEYAAVMAELEHPRDRAIVGLLVGTGLRWGEAMGLHRHRVDYERGWIRVVETWSTDGQLMKHLPKGKRVRDVPLPGWVADLLRALEVVEAGSCGHVHEAGRCRSGMVLHAPGAMTDLDNWRKRVWGPAVNDAGLDHVRPHDLRHTYASWLIQKGIPLEEVGRLLGHTSPVTTKRYAHLADTPVEQILAALDSHAPGAKPSANHPQNPAKPHIPELRLIRGN